MLSLRSALESKEINFVVIAIRNGVGDAVLALPLIRHIVSLIGLERLVIWGNASYGETAFHEFRTRFVPMQDNWRHVAADEALEGVAELRRIVPLHAVIGWVSLNSYPMVSAERVALAELGIRYRWGYTPSVRRIKDGDPQFRRSDQYFRVIGEELMPPDAHRCPQLSQDNVAKGLVYRALAREKGKLLLVIHGEPSTDDRFWPTTHWVRLLSSLDRPVRAVVLGSYEQELHHAISGNQTVPLSWLQQCGIVAAADLFIGIDSSWAHVADSFNVPGVVLFGTASVAQWKPRNRWLRVLAAPEGIMARLPPEHVIESVNSVIGEASINLRS